MEPKIYVRCDNKGCNYISGPYSDVEIANIAARLHEICWMPQAKNDPRHRCYFIDMERTAERATKPSGGEIK